MRAVAYLVAFAVVIVGVAAVTAWRNRERARALVADDVDALFSSSVADVGPQQLRARWDSLPEPVRRYLHYAIPSDTPAIRTARLTHDGFLRTAPDSRWLRVDGEEYFTVAAPGFLWHATARFSPLFCFEARDRLLANRGEMLVKLYSTLRVVDARSVEIDQGARLRWLAEAVWFPYGFVADNVRWTAIDERSATVTLGDQGLPATAVVEIDDEGKLTSVRAQRYRDVGGGKAAVFTPWFGRCRDYREFDGFRVPSSVEVGWILETGEFSAIRFRVTALEFNRAKAWGAE